MALNIKNPRVDHLARRAAELRESTVTEAVEAALERDVIELERAKVKKARRYLADLQARIAKLPVLDPRSARDIQDELNRDILDSHGPGDRADR